MKKLGLDDFLVQYGPDALSNRITNARERVIKHSVIAKPEYASVKALLNSAPKPIPMLIEDLLAQSIVSGLVGQGGTSKTYAGLQIALSVCTGFPLFTIGSFKANNTGQVLYISAEDDRQIMQIRLHEILNSYKWANKIIKFIEKNLFVFDVCGERSQLTEPMGRDCQTTEFLQRLIATAEQYDNLKLIILDPVASFRGGDENSTTDNQRFIEACRLITKRTGATILLIHHANKNSSKTDAPNQNASRGSSAFTDGLRAQINLSRIGDKERNAFGLTKDEACKHVKFTLTKSNYTALSGEIWLRRSEGGALSYAPLTRKDETADVDAIAKVRKLVSEQANKGNEYSIGGFIKSFNKKIGCGRDKLRALIEAAIENGMLCYISPKIPKRNVKRVLAVPDADKVVPISRRRKYAAQDGE